MEAKKRKRDAEKEKRKKTAPLFLGGLSICEHEIHAIKTTFYSSVSYPISILIPRLIIPSRQGTEKVGWKKILKGYGPPFCFL